MFTLQNNSRSIPVTGIAVPCQMCHGNCLSPPNPQSRALPYDYPHNSWRIFLTGAVKTMQALSPFDVRDSNAFQEGILGEEEEDQAGHNNQERRGHIQIPCGGAVGHRKIRQEYR